MRRLKHAGEGYARRRPADRRLHARPRQTHDLITTANILFHIHDALVTQDADGNVRAGARGIAGAIPDPLTWRFKLREGVKFHNGELFDANAVKFTFDRALDPAFKAPNYSRIAAIKSVDVVDKYTVDFKTGEAAIRPCCSSSMRGQRSPR